MQKSSTIKKIIPEIIANTKDKIAIDKGIILTTDAILLILKLDLTVDSISKGTEKSLGYKYDELINKNWFKEAIPKDKYTYYKTQYKNYISSKKKTLNITTLVVCKNKKTKTISWEINKLYVNSKLIGIVSIGKDVTELTTKVRTLEANEKRFRGFAEQMQHPVAFITIKGEFLFLNKAFTKLFGYSINEFPNLQSIVNHTNADSNTKKVGIQIWQDEIKKTFNTQKSISNTIEVETKNREIKIVKYTTTINDGYVCYVYTDITQQKIQEEQQKKINETFKQIANNTPIAIAGCNLETYKVAFTNKQFRKNLGYTLHQINQLNDWGDIIVYENEAEKQKQLFEWEQVKLDLFNGKKSKINTVERKLLCGNGSIKTFEIGITFDNGIIYALFYDITIRKENEKKLKQSEERFRKFAELVPIPISFIKLNGEIIFFNRTYTNQFGYTASATNTVTSLINSLYENDDERAEAFNNWEDDIATLKKGKNVINKRQITYNKKRQKRVMEYTATLSDNFISYAYLDITDRIEKDQIFLKEAETFKNITENTPIAVAGCDYKTLNITFLNKQFYTTFGYVKKDIQNFNQWFDILISTNEEESKKNTKEWQKILENFANNTNKGVNLVERNILCKNGKIKTCQIGFTINDGTIYCFFNDITDRKEAEKKLAESEKRFRNIVENLPIPLVSLNPITGDLFANKKHQQLIGHNNGNEKNKGKKIDKFSINDLLKKESKKHFIELIDKVRNNDINTTILEPTYSTSIICNDKKIRTFEITENIFGNTLYSVLHDITEQLEASELLKESEKKFKALAENMPIAIGGYDAKGKVIFINNYFTKLTGYNIDDVPTVKDWYKKTQPKVSRRTRFYEHWMKIVDDFRTQKNQIKPIVKAASLCKDGTYKHFDFSFSCYDEITYILIIDITIQEKANEELERSYKEIRSLASHLQSIREEERKNISREIHDELGQQLTGIKMDVSAIQKKIKNQPEEIKYDFNNVLETINNSVKTVRKISSKLRPSILDDLGVIATFEWQIQEFIKRTGVDCIFYHNLNENKINIESKNNLFRILQESLTNISRHASATKVNIDFFIAGNEIKLIIADNGKGFNQKSPKETLGIIGMRERASILNGSFFIVSEKTKGTRIIISIPIN